MTISVHNLSFDLPNGKRLFQDLNFKINTQQVTGLVGQNGIGKSTLAKRLCQKLPGGEGKIISDLHLLYVPQEEAKPALSVGEYLSDVWLCSNKEKKRFIERLLETMELAVSCQSLSEGQWAKCRLCHYLAQDPCFLIFDEPTNHLDHAGKSIFLDLLSEKLLGCLVITHDRELLYLVDEIFELSNKGLEKYGGNFELYESEKEHQALIAQSGYDEAKRLRKKTEQEARLKVDGQKKRMRTAQKNAPKMGLPKIVLGALKRQAQSTLGKVEVKNQKALEVAHQEVHSSYQHIKENLVIYSKISQPKLNAAKVIFHAENLQFLLPQGQNLWKEGVTFFINGPQKVAIEGVNGSGKSTLFKLIQSSTLNYAKVTGEYRRGVFKSGCIDQTYGNLNRELSVFENIYLNNCLSETEVRNQLAQFLFQGEKIHQKVSSLSGGELLRMSLAKCIIQDQVPEVLFLDEPTNNLDIENLKFLEGFINSWQGCCFVISHDKVFLSKLCLEQRISLSPAL